MSLPVLARRIVLLILAALYPAIALGLDQTYEGLLLPDDRGPAIPVVVELQEVSTFLRGSVKMSSPLKGNVTIDSGSNVAGYCEIKVVVSRNLTVILKGRCEEKTFDGYYTVYDIKKRSATNGSFHLARKAPAVGRLDTARSATSSTMTATACTKANTQCLAACPRGDTGTELMCASHCRTKYRTCKGQIRKAPAEGEQPLP